MEPINFQIKKKSRPVNKFNIFEMKVDQLLKDSRTDAEANVGSPLVKSKVVRIEANAGSPRVKSKVVRVIKHKLTETSSGPSGFKISSTTTNSHSKMFMSHLSSTSTARHDEPPGVEEVLPLDLDDDDFKKQAELPPECSRQGRDQRIQRSVKETGKKRGRGHNSPDSPHSPARSRSFGKKLKPLPKHLQLWKETQTPSKTSQVHRESEDEKSLVTRRNRRRRPTSTSTSGTSVVAKPKSSFKPKVAVNVPVSGYKMCRICTSYYAGNYELFTIYRL